MSRESVAKIELDKAYDAIVANLKFIVQEYNTNTTSNQNKQQRDYDKYPIVIKNPYEFFLSNLFFFSHCGTVLVLLVYADYMGIANVSNIFLWAFLGLAFCISSLHFIITLLKTNAKPNSQIKR